MPRLQYNHFFYKKKHWELTMLYERRAYVRLICLFGAAVGVEAFR
jgi:hypothetical protein